MTYSKQGTYYFGTTFLRTLIFAPALSGPT